MSWANRTCPKTLEWRNWQTHETQNLALVTQHGGSTPPSSINIPLTLVHVGRALRDGYGKAGVSLGVRSVFRRALARCWLIGGTTPALSVFTASVDFVVAPVPALA